MSLFNKYVTFPVSEILFENFVSAAKLINVDVYKIMDEFREEAKVLKYEENNNGFFVRKSPCAYEYKHDVFYTNLIRNKVDKIMPHIDNIMLSVDTRDIHGDVGKQEENEKEINKLKEKTYVVFLTLEEILMKAYENKFIAEILHNTTSLKLNHVGLDKLNERRFFNYLKNKKDRTLHLINFSSKLPPEIREKLLAC